MWVAAEALALRSPSVADLRLHRLHLIAGEPWTQKLERARSAIGDAFVPKSEHDRRTSAIQPPPFEEERKTA